MKRIESLPKIAGMNLNFETWKLVFTKVQFRSVSVNAAYQGMRKCRIA